MKFEVERINKFKELLKKIVKSIKMALYVLPEVALTLTSVGCTPEVAHASPTDTLPVATQTLTPTNTPIPTPTITPTNTPNSTPTIEPTIIPELSYDEESKIIGYDPLLKEFMAAAIAGIYYEGEEIDTNGNTNIVQRIAFVYLRDIPQTKNFGIHIMFNDTMIFRVDGHPSEYYTDDIPRMKPYSVNENLKNAKIIEAFDIHELKKFCEKRGIQLKETEQFDKITNYIEKNGMQAYIENPYMVSTKDFLQIYLAIPKEYRVPLSETITPDNALPEETVVPSSYRAYTSKDGASEINYNLKKPIIKNSIDDNVRYGYRTNGYYGNSYVVTGRKPYNNFNLNPDQHTKTKI